MADGTQPSLVSATRDVNALTNPLFVKLTDGTTAVTVTGGKLDVNATVSGGSSYVDDAAFGIATDYVQAAGYLADEVTPDSVNEGDIGLARMTLDRKQLFVLADPTTDANRLVIDGTGKIGISSMPSVTVTATDLDIRDLTLALDAVKVSGNATANSLLNPIFVQNVKVNTQANEIHNYSTATPAGDAASNHDYTVTGTTFLLQSVIFSCSGAGKAEIQTGPVASLVTKAVVFLNARQGDTKQVFFDPPIEVPVTSTGTVRVIRTNRNSSATDVYSTIIGSDVA